VKADFWEDVDNCKLVLDDMPTDTTTDFCQDFAQGYEPDDEYVTVTGYPVTVTEYPAAKTCEDDDYPASTKDGYPASTPYPPYKPSEGYESGKPTYTGYGSSNSTGYGSPKPTGYGSPWSAGGGKPETTDAPKWNGDVVTVTSTILTTYTV
jgi:hypothetical protein